MNKEICVYAGEELARYSFGDNHPFGPLRYGAFWNAFTSHGLDKSVRLAAPEMASQEEIEWFHIRDYVEQVKIRSESGDGFLDYGDTPAFVGVYEASARVAGTVLRAVEELMDGRYQGAFVPIAGLHHARRDRAGGFCVFNDCGIAIEALRQKYGVRRVAYVDIDAHHGDGVFYSFEDDPDLIFADLHEDGRYLYPGTGSVLETGKGKAKGTKLNVPMPPGADDEAFLRAWDSVEAFVDDAKPEFILLQCGADSLAGDPITHLRYSEAAHGHAARRLAGLADRHCEGRVLAVGGGGYNLDNLAKAWCAVVQGLLERGND